MSFDSSVILVSMLPPKTLELALLSAAVLGFRHGFDYDHIAAITDITGVDADRRHAMKMGLLYVSGHAFTVASLGAAVIFFQASLPLAIDNWAERAVGLTLVVLGIFVLGSLFRNGERAAPKSRLMILIGAFRWLSWKIRSLLSGEAGSRPSEINWGYSKKSVFFVGVIHGLGAETPSQLLIFLLAANLGGLTRGFLGLAMFLAGLFLMNTLMTASAVGVFSLGSTRHRVMRWMTALTATYSLIVGAIFLFGSAALLPPLGG
jgi:high-affinity nickel permease